jgi:hypothetical protein
MPMGISRLGLRGRSEWVATFFATVRKIERRGPWLTSLHFRSQHFAVMITLQTSHLPGTYSRHTPWPRP